MVVTPRAFVVVGNDGTPQLVAVKEGKYGHVQPAIELEAKSPEASPGTPGAKT
jgi:hypothetical protein